MTKTVRNICVSAVVIVLLIVGIIVVNNIDEEKPQETSADTSSYTVYTENADNIDFIDISGGEDNIKAVNLGNSVWTVNELPQNEVDLSKTSGVAIVISQLTSKNKITENTSDMSQYGLDNPSLIVEVSKKNGESDKLYIGDKSPTLGEYFIIRDGDNTVYTISQFKVDALRKPVRYYREFNRFRVNIDDITRVKIAREDETIEIKIIDNIDRDTNNVWEMVSPYISGANDDYIDDKILEPIDNINLIIPIENTDGGITDKSPALTLTIKPYDNATGKYGGEYTETIIVGKTENNMTYVKYKDGIYSVNAESMSFINESSFNIVSKLQALIDISKVKSVTLEYNGESHVMDISKSGNSYSFKIDGDDANSKLSQTAYQTIIALAVDNKYNGEPLGETIFKLTYKGHSSKDDAVIELRSIDDLNCALTRNGKTEFTIKKSKITEFINTFGAYLKNHK